MTAPILARLKRLAAAVTPGPYFCAADPAEDAPPHTNSGLVLVDTGRESDWPVARLCEQPMGDYIAALDPAVITALVEVADAAAQHHRAYGSVSTDEVRTMRELAEALSTLSALDQEGSS